MNSNANEMLWNDTAFHSRRYKRLELSTSRKDLAVPLQILLGKDFSAKVSQSRDSAFQLTAKGYAHKSIWAEGSRKTRDTMLQDDVCCLNASDSTSKKRPRIASFRGPIGGGRPWRSAGPKSFSHAVSLRMNSEEERTGA